MFYTHKSPHAQEVDRYHDCLEPRMAALGYWGAFMQKPLNQDGAFVCGLELALGGRGGRVDRMDRDWDWLMPKRVDRMGNWILTSGVD